MPILTGQRIGNVNIDVYKTQDGQTFFYIQGNDRNVIPILDYLENSLEKY